MKFFLPLIAITCMALNANNAVAQTIQFDLTGVGGSGLIGANERPAPVVGGGSGGETGAGIFFDDVSKVLTINIGWGSGNGFTDLTGDVTGLHLHGPADQNNSAGVLIGLSGFDASATGGGYTGTEILNATNESRLLNGDLYLNVHTTTNTGGEIRGNLVAVAVPEPGGLAVLCVAVSGMLLRRRRAS